MHFDALLDRLVDDGDGAPPRAAGNHVVDRHVAAHRQAGLNAEPERGPGEHGGGHGRASRARLWRCAAPGRPLLLLHGWGVSSELFAPILDGLQPGRTLIVPDLPGFGATPEPDAPWSVHDYAAWCVALLDRLGDRARATSSAIPTAAASGS